MTPPPDRTIEFVQIVRRIFLFAAKQLEDWLARQGIKVGKPTPVDEDERQNH